MTEIITRREYVKDPKRYREYYAQFVTENTRTVVSQIIGGERIARAYAGGDTNFNTIPLEDWDALTWECIEPQAWKFSTNGKFRSLLPYDSEAFTLADPGGMSRSDMVCIAKEAALQVAEAMKIPRIHHIVGIPEYDEEA